MSMDIRSFFKSSSSKVPKKEEDEVDRKKQKRKVIVISDSESEEESKQTSPKKKPRQSSNKSPKNSVAKSKNVQEDMKSKYFENLKPVNPHDVFGSAPVKQTPVPKRKDKKTVKKANENLEDDDFDDMFLLLDNNKIKELTNEQMKSENNDKNLKGSVEVNGEKVQKEKPSSEKINGSSKEEKVAKKEKESPVKIIQTKAKKTNLNLKNECMILSESDSEEEVKLTFVQTPQKRKNNDIFESPSTKRQKTSSKTNSNIEEKRESPDKQKALSDNTETSEKPQNKIQPSVKFSPVNRPPPIISNLWVDKYRPANLKQLIGQQGENSIVKKLLKWLQNWKKNHSGKVKLSRPSPWAKNDDGAYFKAALLSGPPGIGKTTTAHLVCKELGYDAVEFNASDTRSKKLLHLEVAELLSTKSLAPYFTGGKDQEVTSNHVLLMDEVDGMAGNEDRGGIQELIQLIKQSRIPVICMCNDRNHPKIRSLVNYCFDLRFTRPRVEQIKGAMMSVCFKEGVKITQDQLIEIINSTNQDIRLILNHLSMLSAQKNNNLPNAEKFVKLGPWDVLRKVFSEGEHKKMSFNDKSDLFFHDYSISPLFVHENFLSVVPHAKLNKIKTMQVFAKAAQSISTGDIVDKVIRSKNAWSLLPTQAVFASIVPGDTLVGHMSGQINFPAWLGKNSTKNKMDRLQQELLVHTRLRISASKEAINLDYSKPLRDIIVNPLIQHGSEGVPAAIGALKNYDLLKEDLDNLLELCKWPNSIDPMTKVESKVKAAFTRAYNKSSVISPYAVSAPIKKGRGGGLAQEGDDAFGEYNEDDGIDDVEDDDDSIEADAMISAKKKTASKKQDVPSTSKHRGGQRGGSSRGRGREGKVK